MGVRETGRRGGGRERGKGRPTRARMEARANLQSHELFSTQHHLAHIQLRHWVQASGHHSWLAPAHCLPPPTPVPGELAPCPFPPFPPFIPSVQLSFLCGSTTYHLAGSVQLSLPRTTPRPSPVRFPSPSPPCKPRCDVPVARLFVVVLVLLKITNACL